MNHENVISLPAEAALLQGQIVEITTDGKARRITSSSTKDKAIGVVLHDVDPTVHNDAAAIHLFSGIFIAEAEGPITTGDIIGTIDGVSYLRNSGTLRQLGVSLETVPASEVRLIRVVSS